MKLSSLAIVTAALLGSAATVASNANAFARSGITVVGTTGTTTGVPVAAGGYRGSLLIKVKVYSDADPFSNDGFVQGESLQVNTVSYVYGDDYNSCHDALMAQVHTQSAISWSDCTRF